MNSKETIKKIINETNPDLDTSEGSGITDILINPLSSVLDYYEELLQSVKNSLKVKDPSEMSEDMLDAVASNYMVKRNTGSSSTGTVRILFEKPISVIIPSGSIFSSKKGIEFRSIREYSMTSNQMSNSMHGSYYATGAISVESLGTGEDQQVGAGEINIFNGANFDFVKVTNDVPTSVSSAKESNEDLYNRILQSATSNTALSAASFSKLLSTNYVFKKLIVKGLGDEEMKRGISYAGTSTYNKITSDFYGKRRSVETAPHNANFAGSTVSDGEEPPDLSTVSLNEFTDTNYAGIYLKDDSLKSESLSRNLLNEEFSEDALSSTWYTSDSDIGLDQLKETDEISISSSTVKLGIGEITKPEINITLSRKDVEGLQTNITKVISQLNNYIEKAVKKEIEECPS